MPREIIIQVEPGGARVTDTENFRFLCADVVQAMRVTRNEIEEDLCVGNERPLVGSILEGYESQQDEVLQLPLFNYA